MAIKNQSLLPHDKAQEEMVDWFIKNPNRQEVIVSFSGSGDSGDINEAHDVPEAFNHYAREIIDNLSFDWWNNEGGQGHVRFFVNGSKLMISCIGEYNEMTSTIADDWEDTFEKVSKGYAPYPSEN